MTHVNFRKISHIAFGIGILLIVVLCVVTVIYFKSRANDVASSVSIYEAPPVIESVYITDVGPTSLVNVSPIAPGSGVPKTFYINGTVSDATGDDSIRRVIGVLSRSGASGCPGDTLNGSNSNSCYIVPSCTLDAPDGDVYNLRQFHCDVPVQYNADATTAGDYASENWNVIVAVWNNNMSDTDMPVDNLSDGNSGNDPTFEMDQTLAIGVSPDTINFGTMNAGSQTTSGQAQTITLSQNGNTVADVQLLGPGAGAGDPMVCKSGGTDNGTSIPQANQQFSGSAVAYDTPGQTVTLSTTPFIAQFGIKLQSNDTHTDDNGDNTTVPTANMYAELKLPDSVRGVCSGTVLLTAYPHL